jgi:ribonuclease Z
VKPGPIFRELTEGKSIILPNGTTVEPKDVIGPMRSGETFVIMMCPSKEWIEEILNKVKWSEYYEKLLFMIHITPKEVYEEKLYQAFINCFSKKCKHMVINQYTSKNEIVFHDSTNISLKLNKICKNVFPKPVFSNEEVKDNSLIKIDNLMKFQISPIEKAGMKYDCIINKEFDLEFNEKLTNLIKTYKIEEEKQKFDVNNNHEKILNQISEKDLEITFLGTGIQ